jgi:hypothetical protein
MKTDVKKKNNKQRNLKTNILMASCQPLTKKAGTGTVPKCHGSTTMTNI